LDNAKRKEKQMCAKKIVTVASLTLCLVVLLLGCAPEAAPPAEEEEGAPAPEEEEAAPAAPADEVIKWKVQNHVRPVPAFGPYAAANPEAYHAGVWSYSWMRWIEEATHGRLQIEMLDPDAAFPGQEGLEAVGSGVVDAAWSQPGWYAEKIPEMYVAGGMPMSWSSVGEFYDGWYNYGIYDIVEPLHRDYNIKFFPALGMEHMNIFSDFPMPDVASVKDKKIRFWGQWLEFGKVLGANSVSLPYADCYMAMELGTIEGIFTGAQSLETIKLNEVSSNFIMNPHGCINSLIINLDAWNELPDDIKFIMEVEQPQHFTVGGLMLQEQQAYAMGKAVDGYGFTLWTWSDAEMAELREKCVDVIWPNFAAKSPISAQLVAMVEQQLRDHGKL
jgi:TRAP-type C4-dicarboxylate transport system substrate-binding protein